MPLGIQKLNHGFHHEEVLNGVDVEFESGEFASVLGALGCGKSTLLRLVAGLHIPTSGGIEYGQTGGRPRFGFVFQKPTLLPWLTALQNVLLPLQLGRARASRREAGREAVAQARQALESVELDRIDWKKRPNQLSGGMQMRVSLARAFVTQPSIMLMDEPFAALDEVLRQQLCETTLRLWSREGWTTIFVTHNVHEAVFLSQRVHILAGKPARIVDSITIPFQNRPRELRSEPAFLELAADVGNRLRSAVERG